MEYRLNTLREKIEVLHRVMAEENVYGIAIDAVDRSLATIDNATDISNHVFNVLPSKYETFKACYKEIHTVCYDYSTKMRVHLTTLPHTVLEANENIGYDLNDAINYINTIKNAAKGDDISSEIRNLKKKIGSVSENVSDLMETISIDIENMESFLIKHFPSIIDNIKKILQGIIPSTASYKKAKDDLLKLKRELEKDIKSQESSVAGAAIGVGITIISSIITFLAVVASGGTALPLCLTGAVGVITTVAGTVGLGFAGKKLVEMKEELEDTINKLAANEKDALVLDNYSEDVKEAENASKTLCDNMNIILQAWNDVNAAFCDILTYIEAYESQITNEQWEALGNALEACNDIIGKINTKVGQMVITEMKYTRNEFSVGMTGTEVTNSLKNVELISYKEYMMAI